MRLALTVLVVVSGTLVAEGKVAKRNARQTVVAYVKAVQGSKDADAMALGVEGTKPARQNGIDEFRSALGDRNLELETVRGEEVIGQAIAVSKVQGKSVFVFLLSKKNGTWQIRDVDVKTPEKGKEAVAKFNKRYSTAKDVPAGK